MDGFSTTAASRCKWSLVFVLLTCLLATQTVAATLEVGPGRALTGPSQAAAAAKDGDRIVFDPGVYHDCAIWKASALTIEARRPSSSTKPSIMTRSIIAAPACGDRAMFFFTGNDITVRGMSFVHAKDSQHNGAGILMEGANLTVENSVFMYNENGILAGGPPVSVVRVTGSLFLGNGDCEGACAHALYVGQRIARLEVSQCIFRDTRIGHDIKSRAHMTVVHDTRIEDGDTGTSSYLIELPDGGDAEIANNFLQKGVHSENREVAISIGVPGKNAVSNDLEIHGNRFISNLPDPVLFVRNETPAQARLRNNTLVGRVVPLQGPGTVE